MVSINNLEVRFEVEGDSDEAVFVKLFEKYVKQWQSKQEEANSDERFSARERSLGDRRYEDYEI